jgi:hypothetical protein
MRNVALQTSMREWPAKREKAIHRLIENDPAIQKGGLQTILRHIDAVHGSCFAKEVQEFAPTATKWEAEKSLLHLYQYVESAKVSGEKLNAIQNLAEGLMDWAGISTQLWLFCSDEYSPPIRKRLLR